MHEHQNHGRWTPPLRTRFLEVLSSYGNVRAAATACGLSRQSVYKLRGRDPAFAGEWDAALALRRERVEAALAEAMAAWRTRADAVLAGQGKPLLDTVNSSTACQPA